MTSPRVFAFGDFELDQTRYELRRAGEPVAIQRRVMDLLLFLVEHRDRVATREEIFATVWPGVVVTSAALGHAVMEARRALGEHGDAWIQTVRGRGFRFVAPVGATTAAPPPTEARLSGMVGRSAVWRAVTDALAAAESGRGSVLVIAGDEGSGKTRLLEETRTAAQSRSMTALAGDLDDTRRDDNEDGWRSVLVVRDIEAAARKSPVLLALDDVHLASAEGLAVVQSLARLARRSAVVILVAVNERDLEAEASAAPLQELIRGGTLVRLERLTPGEVGLLVHAHTGRHVDVDEAGALHVATGGNPRLVLQLVSSGLERANALRPGMTLASTADALKSFRRAARARAEALTPSSLRIISAAAVLGRDIVASRVAALLDEQPTRVFEAIDEALGADLVRRKNEGAGSYRFAMGLVRDGLYDSLPEETRARLHHAASRLPSANETADVLIERARHAVRAGVFMKSEERAAVVSHAARALAAAQRQDEAVVLVKSALDAEPTHGGSNDEARRILEQALASSASPVSAGT